MKSKIAKKIYEQAHLTGEFTLRSGQISNEYFDKYIFESEPSLLGDIVKIMKCLIPAESEILEGLEMGGIPIATALSIESGIRAAFVRKKAKEYGTCKLAEGADVNGKRVCVIQRNYNATEILKEEGLTLKAVFTMDYIKSQI